MPTYTAARRLPCGGVPAEPPFTEEEFEAADWAAADAYCAAHDLGPPGLVVMTLSKEDFTVEQAADMFAQFSRSVAAGWDPQRGTH